jgi:uncharacterized OsmC-like protein
MRHVTAEGASRSCPRVRLSCLLVWFGRLPPAPGALAPLGIDLLRGHNASVPPEPDSERLMAMERIAAALHRVESILKRRPEMGPQDDAPAVARWDGGARVVSSHANGASVATDMPAELGGTGHEVTPGWLWRAALSSCLATRIVMAAAVEGIDLTSVEVQANSRSDLRGLMGMKAASGATPSPAPSDVQLHVRICAPQVSHERLQALVAHSQACSPVQIAATQALPIEVSVEVLER